MNADGFDYKAAAGLHRDRLAEAESIRRARAAKLAAREVGRLGPIKVAVGRKLIAIGEKLIAA